MPEDCENRKRVMLLGAGFTGRRLYADLQGKYCVTLTSRRGLREGSGTPEDTRLFNLPDRQSWANVYDTDFVVWTFPAAVEHHEVALAGEFVQQLNQREIPVVVFASTSCYITESPDQLVDESFPLDLSQPRVCAEETLRRSGCLILALAGLYGPGREPADWLRRGLIKNSQQFINLIHVADLARVVRSWLSQPLTGLRLNVSDGRHRRWHEVAEQLKQHGVLNSDGWAFTSSIADRQSKRVSNSALVQHLYAGPFHQYPEDGLQGFWENMESNRP